MITLTPVEANQYNTILNLLLSAPSGKFYLRDILTTHPCSPRVGRAFYERLTNSNIPQDVIVSNLNGNGAVEYEKIQTKKAGALDLQGLPPFFYYSNSIVAGGLPVQSYSTRLTPLTSFTILLATLLSTSHGICAASAVMKSTVLTARSAIA